MGYTDLFSTDGALRILPEIGAFFTGLMVPVIILELLIVALIYFTVSYTLMLIGRKAGETDDWMAYVPIAADIYRLRFVNAPKWHVFFFGFTGTLLITAVEWLLIRVFFSSINIALLVLGLILLLAYAVVSIYVSFQYLTRYYRCFGFHPMLAMLQFTPFLCLFKSVFDLYFAYNQSIFFQKQTDILDQDDCISQQAVTTQGKANVRTKGYLYALNGMYQGATFEIGDMEEISFGRENADCQIVFDQFNTDISRKHCTVRFNACDNTYIVTDYSKNGTFTSEDHRLQPGVPVVLAVGTIIFLGNRENMFRLGVTLV